MILALSVTILFSAGMLAAALSDLEHRRVDNRLILMLAIIAAIWIPAFCQWGNLAGLLPTALLYLLCYKNGQGIRGGADIKLTAAAGLFHGLFGVLPVLLCACVSALAAEITMRPFKARHKGGIPFCFYLGLSSISLTMLHFARL